VIRLRRDQGGLTLLEIVLAMTVLALMVVLLLASLRVGVRAWEAGERRASTQQELRAVIELLTDALSTAVPYRGRLGDAPERRVLFEGEEDAVRFVTTTPPLVLDAPAVPFHAVTLRRTEQGELRLTERLVPAREPFGDEPHVVLSRRVAALRFEYRDDEGLWQTRWDRTENSVPVAVRVALRVREPGGGERQATFVVPIVLGRPGA
jgi:general secretion pathway protein J